MTYGIFDNKAHGSWKNLSDQEKRQRAALYRKYGSERGWFDTVTSSGWTDRITGATANKWADEIEKSLADEKNKSWIKQIKSFSGGLQREGAEDRAYMRRRRHLQDKRDDELHDELKSDRAQRREDEAKRKADVAKQKVKARQERAKGIAEDRKRLAKEGFTYEPSGPDSVTEAMRYNRKEVNKRRKRRGKRPLKFRYE